MANKILLLEDEVNVGSTLKDRLNLEGYETLWTQTVTQAKESLLNHTFSLALLDVHLPDGSGFEVGEQIKLKHPFIPMIFLTAAGTPDDRIRGLELGAEDYVVKPFHFKELSLRIKNVLKRSQYIAQDTHANEEVKIGKATVNFNQYELLTDKTKIHLSHKECALLKLLYEKRGNVVSRDEILNLVWSEDEYPTPRTIDNFILRLRKLIEPDINIPSVIRSVRSIGYLMEKS